MYQAEFQRALKLIHDLKFRLVMASCENGQLVPVPGFGFIPECIRNNIETQYQVSLTLWLVWTGVTLLTGSSFIPSCLHLLTLL